MEARDVFERADGAVNDERGSGAVGRPWLGVRFTCGGGYLRVYRSADGTRYQARCPTCGRAVTFKVGQGGTNERFFEVQCGR